MKRRRLLQCAAATLATLGLSQLEIQQQSIRYARVLAQPTPRKKALLVGINQYTSDRRFNDLKGCLTDVELQQRLLIDRFGFRSEDVHILTDATPQKPTRENILNEFENHLIRDTQPGDVVVFHFSGHGSRFLDPNPRTDATGTTFPYNSTLVPTSLPNATETPDIMGKTLFLLTSAINTDYVTVVLDSCHSGGGTRGNCRVRSGDDIPGLQPSATELAYQERWLKQLAIDPEEFAQQRNLSVAKGVFLASARADQRAYDATFNQYDAGVFTCFLTQYLWHEFSTVETAIAITNRSIDDANIIQNPFPDVKAGSGFEQKPVYFIEGMSATPPAEAVLVERQGDRGIIWLGGVDPASLVAFDQGATFILAGATEGNSEIKLLSRNGLRGEVLLPPGISANAHFLQESARVIPANLTLRIGLDPSLGMDRVTAQSKLQSIRRVEPVLAQSGNTPYPGEIQYILTRMTPAYRTSFPQQQIMTVPINSIGLMSQSLDEIIPDSFGAVEESVEQAIARLTPKLTSLVAARMIKLTLNANSSRLNIEAAMQLEGQSTSLIASAFTVRGGNAPAVAPAHSSPPIKVGDPLQFRITNRETTELYISILVIDSAGEITVLQPNQLSSADDTTRLGANQTLLIPDPAKDSFQFAAESKGSGEALIIASRSPLRQALIALRNLAVQQNLDPSRGGTFVTPSAGAIGDLLSDLSGDRGGSVGASRNSILQVNEIAALSITFEVV